MSYCRSDCSVKPSQCCIQSVTGQSTKLENKQSSVQLASFCLSVRRLSQSSLCLTCCHCKSFLQFVSHKHIQLEEDVNEVGQLLALGGSVAAPSPFTHVYRHSIIAFSSFGERREAAGWRRVQQGDGSGMSGDESHCDFPFFFLSTLSSLPFQDAH